jgi:thiosulfate reductase cytochrome b subunit
MLNKIKDMAMAHTLKREYLFTRYERIWHWLQMTLILVLLITGFEIHSSFSFIGFEKAVKVHNFAGLLWLISFFLFVFWLFTTGEWKQYKPTTKKMFSVIFYYSYGIFKGDKHPFAKSSEAKHNPLQRLTYLALASALLPVQLLSGFLYWGYNNWGAWGIGFVHLNWVAVIHMAGAFAILQFLIIHIYMTTTGSTVFEHIKTMITGYEEIEEGEKVRE